MPSSSDVELYSSHQLFHAATQLYSHYTQIIWPIILCEDVLSAIKFLYNLNYTIILLYSAPNVLYEASAGWPSAALLAVQDLAWRVPEPKALPS